MALMVERSCLWKVVVEGELGLVGIWSETGEYIAAIPNHDIELATLIVKEHNEIVEWIYIWEGIA